MFDILASFFSGFDLLGLGLLIWVALTIRFDL